MALSVSVLPLFWPFESRVVVWHTLVKKTHNYWAEMVKWLTGLQVVLGHA